MSQPTDRNSCSPSPVLRLFLLISLITCYQGPVLADSTRRIDEASRGRELLAKPVAQPNYTLYHRKDDLLGKVEALVKANSKTFSVETSSVGDSSYKTDVMVITVDLAGLGSSSEGKVRYLMDFGQHGRELISSELGLRFMQTLVDPEAVRSALKAGSTAEDAKRGEELYRRVRDQAVFKILPMENTGGRAMVEAGQLCERKNGRGVDPNRNYEVDWGIKEKDYDPNEEFPGTKPFSEPESQVVLRLAQEMKPHVWLNVHSGMEALFTPWDHKAEVPEAAKHALSVITQIKADFFADNAECVVGSGGKSVGYLAHGTATDYMFERLHVPLPFTWEIFGDLQADYHDCFKMFNPIDQKQFDATISVWLKAMFRLIELAPGHPDVAADLAKADKKKKPASAALSPAPSSSPSSGTIESLKTKEVDGKPGPGSGGSSAEGKGDEGTVEILVSNSWVGSTAWDSFNWIKFGLGMLGLLGLIIFVVRYFRGDGTMLDSRGRARGLPL